MENEGNSFGDVREKCAEDLGQRRWHCPTQIVVVTTTVCVKMATRRYFNKASRPFWNVREKDGYLEKYPRTRGVSPIIRRAIADAIV